MLYAVIKRFDSLSEITTSLLADTNKLAHIGITFKIGRSTLADANKRRSVNLASSTIVTCSTLSNPIPLCKFCNRNIIHITPYRQEMVCLILLFCKNNIFSLLCLIKKYKDELQ